MIDNTVFSQLEQDVGPELAKKLLQVYVTESKKVIDNLIDPTKQQEIEINAHSLKSSSLSYGALELGKLCGQIEVKANERQFDSQLSNLISQAEHQSITTFKHAERLINGS
ncbi:hypothetical protein AMS58_08360 [Pseudoalteromonas porphyrae]|uniref:HPt domain-containing protein n=1 Tax=Pseudoalteromonas porphyrae TaxID=187330 RepID=A0A0N0M125_9GAMM|nr:MULTISPECIES: Hpt domain-containing protein [Pseudoalteromonas]KPH64119.1 hypothetical protein ADS77_06835 [Pseudoalteromonas porphyrae]KPH94930.1 hypothetical protein AMS58_08360 [Pseudoalteromonas porphyrae]NNG43001.1 Hpt domain-containing protein [Pseudoalteromonas sp. NEC-BIFX-2020_002]